MNYKTQARLVYGGLLIAILIFVRIVAGWYGVFDKHSPERGLAAEIERDIGHDVLNIARSSDIIEGEEMLLVYVLTNEPVSQEEVLDWVGSRAPAVFYFYQARIMNSSEDGSLQGVLYGVGFMLCFSSEECGWRDTGEFVSDKPQDMAIYGLASPQVKVVISLKGSGAKMLLVGKKAGKSVYVRTASAESVYLVDAGIVEDLTRGWLGFRDRQMMEFRRDDVKRIDLRRKDETVAFIKQERDWRIIQPIREKAKNYQVIDMMRKLDSLKAEKFVAEKTERLLEYGLDQPHVEITLTLEDDSTKALLVGEKMPDSDLYYAKIADADIIFVIKKDVVDELEKDLSEIRE